MNAAPRPVHTLGVRRAFTLIELLVVIAVIGLLLGVLLPALSSAREAARGAACLSNLRSMYVICRSYADENRGLSPALGVPYGTLPNWALVVQSAAGVHGQTSGELYAERSVLVCPSARGIYGPQMQRTYAINATGHAGQPDDADDFDAALASIRMDRVERNGEVAMFLDAAPTFIPPPAPPPTRCASVVDFRNPDHVSLRIGRPHAARKRFASSMFDGSARVQTGVPDLWREPLP